MGLPMTAIDGNRFVDVLLLTALAEETFLLTRALELTAPTGAIFDLPFKTGVLQVGGKTVPYIDVSIGSGREARIAWADLDGMGNVWAYDAALRWIERLSPRCVFLVRSMIARGI